MPLRQLQSGPVWDREIVEAWVKDHQGDTTHVISFINLKGGVGKTTLAVGVAEILAQEHNKHVLVVDLDPQTNASVTLIPEERWKAMDDAGQTIAQLFDDRLSPKDTPRFVVEESIARRVSTIDDGIARLDLLPSSMRLIELQERIPLIAMTGNYMDNPLVILKDALESVIDRYDYVIIDCPPSLGPITKNGLRISTGYIIPTIPDVLSTWGIYQIVDNVHRFSQDIHRPIPALGIVATKWQSNNLHRRIVEDLRAQRLGRFGKPGVLKQPPLFDDVVPQTVDVARGVDVDADIRTFKGKYGRAYDSLRGIANQLSSLCETKRNS